MIGALKLFLLTIIAIVMVTFTVNNRESEVLINLFPLPFEVVLSAWQLIYLILIIGVVVGSLFSSVKNMRYRNESRKYKKEVDALRHELASKKVESNLYKELT